jgi:hypothetical protein
LGNRIKAPLQAGLGWKSQKTARSLGALIRFRRLSIRHSPEILASLDEDFLPDVDLGFGNIDYTIVIGEVLGDYEAEKK